MRIGIFLVLVYLSLIGQPQLDHFDFEFPTGLTQVAGIEFPIIIVAIDNQGDTFRYNFDADLTTTFGSRYISPTSVRFYNGVCDTNITVTLSDTLRVICSSMGVTDTSARLTVKPNIASHLLLLTPGETHDPGIPPGKYGNPNSHYAGEDFTCTVLLTDDWFNRVGSGNNDSIFFSSTDQFAPQITARMTGDSLDFTFHFRTSGSQELYIYDKNPQISGDTSRPIMVLFGNYTQLLLLLPGEDSLPGDTTTWIPNTPGKSGAPYPQYMGEGFPVRVLACDSFWNLNTGMNNYQIEIRSDFWCHVYPPVAVMSNGVARFDSVVFDSSGENQNLWAVDLNTGRESYRCNINILARARHIEAYPDSDTITAGHITPIYAKVLDIHGKPLWDRAVYFEVVSGHGEMLDTLKSTDTSGIAIARFFASTPYVDEFDTIRIRSDTAETLISIYVQVPESLVIKGKIVAFPNPLTSSSREVVLLYYLPSACNVKILIYDTFGNPVRKWELAPGEEGARMGVNRFIWDGKDAHKRRVASGAYIVRIIGYSHTETPFNQTVKVGVVW
ncbi:hypothetical protein DRP53_00530 [candidate division WOR-3 bacterium]|uniref:FlgD Ig-like domain-containing protein n=1 Tax=candidate division WOR-3 bacterium TaxID=2052148 RepID=A0A660SLN5_UNCW3|nr:MAG: hypothetical protein DRP53_00530 [candidate division WOR-3 bacterium]